MGSALRRQLAETSLTRLSASRAVWSHSPTVCLQGEEQGLLPSVQNSKPHWRVAETRGKA